jgi:hypothetical protein
LQGKNYLNISTNTTTTTHTFHSSVTGVEKNNFIDRLHIRASEIVTHASRKSFLSRHWHLHISVFSHFWTLAILAARGQVDDEEDVQLDDGGEDEEAGVHNEADDAHLAVQHEFVAEKGHIEQEEGGKQRDGAVLEAGRLDGDVVVVVSGGHERRLDEPRQAQTQQNVEGVRADRVADAHRAET